jgi:hypothetical protein
MVLLIVSKKHFKKNPMQIFKAFYLIFFLLLFSCSQSSNNSNSVDTKLNPKVDSLYKLVVAKHDEVMPKDKDIVKLINILRQKLEIEKDNSTKEKILNLLQFLQSGHDAMFDWMGAFKNLHLDQKFYENKSEKELLDYLSEEEAKIDRVAKLMLEGIDNAELFLKEINK